MAVSLGCSSKSTSKGPSAGGGGSAGQGGASATGGTGNAAGSGAASGGGSAGAGGSGTGGSAGVGASAGSGGNAGSTGGTSGDAGPVKRVFATSKTYDSNLKLAGSGTSGLNGADKICTLRAAKLGGTWTAWLSAGEGAFDRIKGNGPWYLVNGSAVVFANRAALQGTPAIPINRDENGDIIGSNVRVWTGTNAGGIPAGNGQRCNGWTGGVALGQYGNINSAGVMWTNAGLEPCAPINKNRLICFEQ